MAGIGVFGRDTLRHTPSALYGERRLNQFRTSWALNRDVRSWHLGDISTGLSTSELLRLYSPLDSFFTKEWRLREIELVR
jgi:hypothetical protein